MSMQDIIKKRADAIGKETAYPTTSEGAAFGTDGMTKLELFAAMAMQGLSGKIFEADIRERDIINESLSLAKALCVALSVAELEGGQNG